MNRPRLIDVRNSPLPQAIGVCADNLASIASWVNLAQERLLHDPLAPDEGWYGGWARMRFSVVVDAKVGYITTPREVARLIVMSVCKQPIFIRNGFYEFLSFGTGIQPKTCNTECTCDALMEAYERESVAYLGTLESTAQLIRVYPTDSRDVGKRVLIQGADQNSNTVTSTDVTTGRAILGEYITLASPFADSTSQFSTITGVQKDTTYGSVTITQVDPTTLVEADLSEMEPGEEIAAYRKYMLNGLPSQCCDTVADQVAVEAQVKLDFIPVKSDSDYLLIQSIPALIEECKSIRHGLIDDGDMQGLADKEHGAALRLLFGQLDHYQGKRQTAIGFSLFGSDKLTAQPR